MKLSLINPELCEIKIIFHPSKYNYVNQLTSCFSSICLGSEQGGVSSTGGDVSTREVGAAGNKSHQ